MSDTQPTDAQKIEALSNEVAILRQANANAGVELASQKVETVRWHMTSEAQVKIIEELRARTQAPPAPAEPARATLSDAG